MLWVCCKRLIWERLNHSKESSPRDGEQGTDTQWVLLGCVFVFGYRVVTVIPAVELVAPQLTEACPHWDVVSQATGGWTQSASAAEASLTTADRVQRWFAVRNMNSGPAAGDYREEEEQDKVTHLDQVKTLFRVGIFSLITLWMWEDWPGD